jgi:predicted ABC-type ATPase
MPSIRAPQLVMIAGPNGSGKSTLIAALRGDPNIELPAVYINADDLQRERRISDPLRAQQLAAELRGRAFAARSDVMYETVMSHPSKIAELQAAKAAGYHVTVHLVATEDPAINVQRVGVRVGAGGHDVPADRIRTRYQRTLALAPLAIAYADQAVVFDNTQSGDTGRGLTVHAALQVNRLEYVVARPAAWVHTLATLVNERAIEFQGFAEDVGASSQPPQLAKLAGGSTQGPIIAIGKHYVLQLDELSRSTVLHDRLLLGVLADSLALQDSQRLTYREGVVSIEPASDSGAR